MVSFNLVSAPWIPVVNDNGTSASVGIRDALLEAHRIGRITAASPLAEVVIHRLLLAVLHRALDGPQDTLQAVDLYKAGRLPKSPVECYLQQWQDRFDLFHSDRPFYQVPDLPEEKPRPWTILLPEFASGNNPTLFDHNMDDNPPAASPAKAALALLVHQSFTPGGLIRQLGATSGKAAPLANAAVFLLQGGTLFETLLLNLCAYKSEGDQPIWERGPYYEKDLEGGKANAMLSGTTRIYTWMSRAVRLLPDKEGLVRFIAYGPGVRPLEGPELDPMCAYQRTKSGLSAYRLPQDRSFWRDFEALLPGEGDWQPPRVLEHGRVFLQDLQRTSILFPLVVAGQLTSRAKVLNARREIYPLAARTLEPEPASYVRRALGSARDGGDTLNRVGWALAANLLSPDSGQAPKDEIGRLVQSLPLHSLYWSTLEDRFPRFLADLVESEPEEALKHWKGTVAMAARDAWNQTADVVGTGPRHLKAIAKAGGCSSTNSRGQRMMDTKPDRFLKHLRNLRDDRGAMASLRHTLVSEPGQPLDARAYRYVEPFVQGEDEWRRAMYYLVAGLYAFHPQEGEQTLAEAMCDMWLLERQHPSTENRFLALLDADTDQLPDRLRRVVAYLRSKSKGLDYPRLLSDLLQWRRPDRSVQRRWARQFYGASQQQVAEEEASGEVEP